MLRIFLKEQRDQIYLTVYLTETDLSTRISPPSAWLTVSFTANHAVWYTVWLFVWFIVKSAAVGDLRGERSVLVYFTVK